MTIASINPATGETFKTFAEHPPGEVERRLALAAAASRSWRRVTGAERAAALRRAADLLEGEKRRGGEIMTVEMGKPIGAAVAEAEKCAWVCRFYADHAADFLAPERVETDARESFVRYEPLGVVLAVMPWN